MGQQRDALLIICIPCTDSEREEGSNKVILQTLREGLQWLLDNVLRFGCGKWMTREADQKEKGF